MKLLKKIITLSLCTVMMTDVVCYACSGNERGDLDIQDSAQSNIQVSLPISRTRRLGNCRIRPVSKMSQKPSKSGDHRDHEKVVDFVKKFSAEECKYILSLIESTFKVVMMKDLKTLAILLAKELQLELPREAKRNKWAMVKWFHDHWNEVKNVNVTILSHQPTKPVQPLQPQLPAPYQMQQQIVFQPVMLQLNSNPVYPPQPQPPAPYQMQQQFVFQPVMLQFNSNPVQPPQPQLPAICQMQQQFVFQPVMPPLKQNN